MSSRRFSQNRDLLAQITFMVGEGKEETLNLYKGNKIEEILTNFCKKYNLDNEIRHLIELELINQLESNGVDIQALYQQNLIESYVSMKKLERVFRKKMIISRIMKIFEEMEKAFVLVIWS